MITAASSMPPLPMAEGRWDGYCPVGVDRIALEALAKAAATESFLKAANACGHYLIARA